MYVSFSESNGPLKRTENNSISGESKCQCPTTTTKKKKKKEEEGELNETGGTVELNYLTCEDVLPQLPEF